MFSLEARDVLTFAGHILRLSAPHADVVKTWPTEKSRNATISPSLDAVTNRVIGAKISHESLRWPLSIWCLF